MIAKESADLSIQTRADDHIHCLSAVAYLFLRHRLGRIDAASRTRRWDSLRILGSCDTLYQSGQVYDQGGKSLLLS